MKILKGVVKVVAVVASIAALIPGPWQPIAAIVATVASAISVALEIIAPYKAKASPRVGSPTEYRLDPQAGIPMMLGRTQFAGNGVKRETWGEDNKYQGFTTVYSMGPVQQLESFMIDRDIVGIAANASAIGILAGFLWFNFTEGNMPNAFLDCPVPGYPGWTADHKLSGLAHGHHVLMWDKNGKKFQGGAPTPGVILQGMKVYDPRLDSTYPGGSGPCRPLQEATYVYSDTPHLHALTFALGRWQNGKRRAGLGFPISSIDVPYFVSAANTDEMNGWKISGLIYNNDNKWNALKQMMEAGGAAPMMLGGRLSGSQSAPRVPLPVTITSADVVGRSSIIPSQTMRERINAGVPRFRSEAHGWETVSADAVTNATYEAADGERKTEEFEWHLVSQPDQAAQLTGYMIANSRELGPIELVLRPRWIGVKPGDCVPVNIPDLGLVNQRCIVTNRSFDGSSGQVSLTLKSETDAKHDYVLGRTAVLPPNPSLTVNRYATPPAPALGAWALSVGALSSGGGRTPSLRFSGAVTAANAEGVELAIRKSGDAQWSVVLPNGAPDTVRFDETAVLPGASYEGRVRYIVAGRPSDPLYLSAVTVDTNAAATASVADSIVGQGALATLNVVNVGTHIVDPGSTTPTTPVPRTDIITPIGTAAGISGQGPWATDTTITPGRVVARTQYVGDDGYIDRLDRITNRRLTLLKRADGATDLTEAAAITSLGTASAVAGQTAWATYTAPTTRLTNLSDAGDFSSLGNITTRNLNQLNNRAWTNLFRANGATAIADADAITSLGVASGIAGQGSFATRNSVAYGESLLTGFGWLASRNNARLGAEVVRQDGSTTVTDAAAITSLGVASGITGQGPWATYGASISTLTNPGANLVFNASGQLGHKFKWNQDGGAAPNNFGIDGYGPSAYWHSDGTQGIGLEVPFGINAGLQLPLVAGVQITGSIETDNDGGSSSYVRVQWFSAANAVLNTQDVSLPIGNNFGRFALPFAAAPAGTAYAKAWVRVAVPSSNTIRWRRLKFEIGGTATPFSDEATSGSILDVTTGRIRDAQAYNTQRILGASSTTNLNPTYTVGASNVTVSLPAHTRKIAGQTGPVTLSYGAVSGVVAFSTYWTAYIDDPDLTGFASPTVVFTTNPDDLLAANRYQIASGVTPSSAGTGGTTTSGGGGSRVDNCVEADSFMPNGILAREVKEGDLIEVIDETTWEGFTYTDVRFNSVVRADCVEIESESGITLVLSRSTPCTLKGGSAKVAAAINGHELAVRDAGGFRWERIVRVTNVGMRDVAHISAHDSTYAAGKEPGRFIYTHNTYYKP